MEWFFDRPLTKGWGRWFLVLAVGLLISIFTSSLVSMNPVSAQGSDNQPGISQNQEEGEEDDSDAEEDSENLEDESFRSSCAIPNIGWIICGPASWIADGMDVMYEYLTGFLQVRPLGINNTSSFYQAWNIMRGIANAAFIIAFLIIVYSQITSLGISNYGIKKMAPRLIIAAILVNLSYLICVVLVDLSNIAGVTVKDMFDNITKALLQNSEYNIDGMLSISSITQAFLTGGALTVAGISIVGGSTLAATPFFIPILAMLFLSLLVALLVMAARQAMIVILVVISPLAFVAYLLPGTEKWFEKWRNTFLTMLLFFPAFAAVFGGATLAGVLIMTNAQSIVVFILGFAVVLAPLAITPFIMKLGGGVLNKFAGIINDPAKGMVDRSKAWAKDQSKIIGTRRQKSLADYEQRRRDKRKAKGRSEYQFYDNLLPLGGMRRIARGIDHRSRLTKDRAEDAGKQADNMYHDSRGYKRHDLRSRQTADRSELLSQQASNRYDEMKGGKIPTDIQPSFGQTLPRVGNKITQRVERQQQPLMNDIRVLHESIAVEGIRKSNAQRELNQQLAREMLQNEQLQNRAKSIYEFGIDAAKATAVSTMRSDEEKSVGEAVQLMKHFKVDAEKRQDLLRGNNISVERDGVSHIFDATNSPFAIEAALKEQLAVGTVPQISEILAMSGSGAHLAEFRGSISEGLASSSVKGKAPFLGGKLIDDVVKGEIKNMDDLQNYIASWVRNGKFKPADVSIIDKDGLELLMSSIGEVGSLQRTNIGEDRLKGLSKKIDVVFSNPELAANVADNAEEKFRELRGSLPNPDPTTGGS